MQLLLVVKLDELTSLLLFDKALLAWRDTTFEKCWQSWLLFMKSQQIERNEIIILHQRLAGKEVHPLVLNFCVSLFSCSLLWKDDFYERRLLAISFDALELQYKFTRSRLAKGVSILSTLRQRCIFYEWQNTMVGAKKARSYLEELAKRNGTRLNSMKAIRNWRCVATEIRNEREINKLIEAKRREVNKWLEYNPYS